MKDASAAAIYGVRAANGVILITTKRGGEGAPKFDYSFRAGIQNIPNTFDLLGVPNYVNLYREAFRNNPTLTASMPVVFNPSDTVERGRYQDYLGNRPTIDWQAPMLNNNAPLMDHSVKLYGGTKTLDYYIGGGYTYQEGPFIYNDLQRYTFSSNVNSKGKIFDIGANIKATYMETRNQSPQLIFAVSAPPWQPLLDQDDYYADDIPNRVRQLGYATPIDTIQTINEAHPVWGGNGQPDRTPIWNQDAILKYGPETEGNYLAAGDPRINETNFEYIRTLGTVYAVIKFLKDFKLKGSYSVDWYNQRRNNWSSIVNQWYRITPGNMWAEGDFTGTTVGSYGQRHTRNYSLTGEISLNYNNSFGDHNVDLLFNFMDQQIGFDVNTIGSGQLLIDDPDRRFVPEQTLLTLPSTTSKG
ncbi:MAG: hypothetical protein HC880_03520 [Bacteroidia bacterium]|nr:hypothetical protein [Bacteroidia bacterium]